MLMRLEPFREFERMSEAMVAGRRVRQVPADAFRRGDEVRVVLDLPGADPGSIDLTVDRGRRAGESGGQPAPPSRSPRFAAAVAAKT
jgi:HSP20 family molecular chaperone IbpA